MAGEVNVGTMTNINCRDKIAAAPNEMNLRPSLIKLEGALELSQAFSQLSNQMQNLNALILNGVPLMINVPPAQNHVTVEPPVVRVDTPVIRVENIVPAQKTPIVQNEIVVSSLVTKKEAWLIAYLFITLLCLQFVSLVGILWKLSQ